MPFGGVRGHKWPNFTRLLVALLFKWLFTVAEQRALLIIVRGVKADERIPVVDHHARTGREFRRDEASIRAANLLCLKHSKANLGCELAYWMVKE